MTGDFMPFVGTIGGGFFAGLIAESYGWRWSFAVFGSLGVLLGFALTRFLVEPSRGAAESPAGAASRLPRTATLNGAEPTGGTYSDETECSSTVTSDSVLLFELTETTT